MEVILKKYLGSENYIFIFILALIFYVSYWCQAVGLEKLLILILPMTTFSHVLWLSVAFLLMLPFIYIVGYSTEILIFKKFDESNIKIIKIIIGARFLQMILLCFFWVFYPAFLFYIIIIQFILAFTIGKIFKLLPAHTLVRTEGKLNFGSIFMVTLLSYYTGCEYSDYVKLHYMVRQSERNVIYHLLGHISGSFVIESGSTIVVTNNMILLDKK